MSTLQNQLIHALKPLSHHSPQIKNSITMLQQVNRYLIPETDSEKVLQFILLTLYHFPKIVESNMKNATLFSLAKSCTATLTPKQETEASTTVKRRKE